MKVRIGLLVACLGLLSSGAGLVAHHSFTTEYTADKTFSFKGTVSKVEWTNPHVRFYVDVIDQAGAVATWNLELASPSALSRNGWTSRTLKVGDEVAVEGYAAKVAPNRGNVRTVVTPDGRSLFAGAADDGAPSGGE
jgi:hypothetical protein